MSIILQSLASPTIEEAIEANFNEEMAHLGYGLPQGELHKTMRLEHKREIRGSRRRTNGPAKIHVASFEEC